MRRRTLVIPLVVVGAVAVVRRRSRVRAGAREAEALPAAPPTKPSSPSRPVTPAGGRRGDVRDRGTGGTLRMDLDRARAARVDPVVEFLTYVQQRRGDRHHLLFVRTDDIDAMAEAADEPVDAFLSRLDQLGVVVSHN